MTVRVPATSRPTLTGVTLAALPYLTLLGCAGLVATIVLGFEQPHTRMLVVSALLLATAPLGVALHLIFTRELSREDKRAWLSGLASLKDPGLFGAYFTPAARRQATERLRTNARDGESNGG